MLADLFGSYHQGSINWQTALLSFLVAAVLSSLIAKTYQFTYEGLSWSKSLVQSLILGSLVTCMIMMAIGDNVARGIGVFGTLAIIRFRTNLRDPRDIIYMFAALGTGIAAGAQSFVVGAMGTLIFCLLSLLLKVTDLGSLRQHHGSIRFQLPTGSPSIDQVKQILKQSTRRHSLVSMVDLSQGTLIDFTYEVTLRDVHNAEGLLQALQAVEQMRGLKYISQESAVEL